MRIRGVVRLVTKNSLLLMNSSSSMPNEWCSFSLRQKQPTYPLPGTDRVIPHSIASFHFPHETVNTLQRCLNLSKWLTSQTCLAWVRERSPCNMPCRRRGWVEVWLYSFLSRREGGLIARLAHCTGWNEPRSLWTEGGWTGRRVGLEVCGDEKTSCFS
jgi:hypothetical protein